MKQNQYRPVPGYEGLYEIAQTGSIRNVQTGKELHPRRHNQYLRVRLYKAQLGREKFVHALTRAAFPELYPEQAPKSPETDPEAAKKARTDTTYLQEEWRPIYGTQKAYMVSNLGRVKHEDDVYIEPNEKGIVKYKPPHGKAQYRSINTIMAENFEASFRPKFRRVKGHITFKQVEKAGRLYDTRIPVTAIAKRLNITFAEASILIFNYRT